MPIDVLNLVASEVILGNTPTPVDPATKARVSIAAALVPGPIGLALPIITARRVGDGGGGGGGGGGGNGVAVPDVTGLSQASAEAVLKRNRLAFTSVQAFSTEVTKEDVISQTPDAGTILPLGGTVRLVISLGPPDIDNNGDTTPVTTADLDEAKEELENRFSTGLDGLKTELGNQINTVSANVEAAKNELDQRISDLGAKIDNLAYGRPSGSGGRTPTTSPGGSGAKD